MKQLEDQIDEKEAKLKSLNDVISRHFSLFFTLFHSFSLFFTVLLIFHSFPTHFELPRASHDVISRLRAEIATVQQQARLDLEHEQQLSASRQQALTTQPGCIISAPPQLRCCARCTRMRACFTFHSSNKPDINFGAYFTTIWRFRRPKY